jgi:hypothetical protein
VEVPILYLHRWQTAAKRLGLIPHDRPVGHLFVVLPAFCPQIAPIEPFLPVMPVHKYRAVYNLRFESFHGMEEVIGSIPIRSTNKPFNTNDLPALPDRLQLRRGC